MAQFDRKLREIKYRLGMIDSRFEERKQQVDNKFDNLMALILKTMPVTSDIVSEKLSSGLVGDRAKVMAEAVPPIEPVDFSSTSMMKPTAVDLKCDLRDRGLDEGARKPERPDSDSRPLSRGSESKSDVRDIELGEGARKLEQPDPHPRSLSRGSENCIITMPPMTSLSGSHPPIMSELGNKESLKSTIQIDMVDHDMTCGCGISSAKSPCKQGNPQACMDRGSHEDSAIPLSVSRKSIPPCSTSVMEKNGASRVMEVSVTCEIDSLTIEDGVLQGELSHWERAQDYQQDNASASNAMCQSQLEHDSLAWHTFVEKEISVIRTRLKKQDLDCVNRSKHKELTSLSHLLHIGPTCFQWWKERMKNILVDHGNRNLLRLCPVNYVYE